MKFVIAPDKFKGSLTGAEFCTIVEKAVAERFPRSEIVKVPLADGGDGTIEVAEQYLGGKIVGCTVNDPLFRAIECHYLFSEKKETAFIEMAEASGHRLLQPHELNCMLTTTLGTGELVANAIQKGAKHIFLGIGGSATNDGGMGMAQALGYAFFGKDRKILSPIGKNLAKVAAIIPPKKSLSGITVKVACDVDNPFYGENGAARVYAKQKGASASEIVELDGGLRHFASIVSSQMGIDLQKIPGAGAAGGVGGGAVAFLNAELLSGIDLVKEMADFGTKIKDADWIITGEGKLDDQTLSGKTIGGVIASAQKQHIPVAAFCGAVALSEGDAKKMGLAHVSEVSKGIIDLNVAMAKAGENLYRAVREFLNALET